MANELKEVLPAVHSMPTTGWFCQTSGSARKRVTRNTSSFKSGSLDIEGTFDVKGVPGHTHNANAVVSVDANYSKYRSRALTVPAGIWSRAQLDLPVGLLTDSDVVDNAAERYERAIERCVGYTGLFPENCTGHIREPTRSIGEIRTLVTPKARLDTLTYVEERGGWMLPNDADDQKETTTRTPLVSDFPDVYIDVRPLGGVFDSGVNAEKGVNPASAFLESATHRYKIAQADAAAGTDVIASGNPSMELRFVWDDDQKLYRTLAPQSFTLHEVQEVELADGADTGEDPYTVAAGNNAAIMITFPVMQTTRAFDGCCWLANMSNEEALHYAKNTQVGLLLAPRVQVEVLGISRSGPFTYIGMPAYRIPIGSPYAFPAPGILKEHLTEHNFTFWDSFESYKTDGLLKYDRRRQLAEAAHAAGNTQETTAARSPATFNFHARGHTAKGGTFRPYRDSSNSILGQLHYAVKPYVRAHHQPDYTRAVYQSLAAPGVDLTNANNDIDPIESAVRNKAAAVDIPNAVVNHSDVFTGARAGIFSMQGTFGLRFAAAAYPNALAAHTLRMRDTDDCFCTFAGTPLLYAVNAAGAANFTGADELFLSADGLAREYIPKVIALINNHESPVISYDFSGLAEVHRSYSTVAAQGTLAAPTAVDPDGDYYYRRGFTFWLKALDGSKSNFTLGEEPAELSQVVRNAFRDAWSVGNTFAVPRVLIIADADHATRARVLCFDIILAYPGVVGSTVFLRFSGANSSGRLYSATVRRVTSLVNHAGFDQGARAVTVLENLRRWDHAAQASVDVTEAQANAANELNAAGVELILPGPGFIRAHQDAFDAIAAASNENGAVFQSIKRISQHVCAPVLNPNLRINSAAPLNYDSRHLPPEMRDFRLQLQEIDWGRLQTDRVSINELTLYQFRDGVQTVGAQQNVMYLPQFREFKRVVAGGTFELTVFSELGCPSYFCFFVRSATTDILQQPKISTLSIRCETTKKKSNTITGASVGQLYHLTQRNVHPAAEYDRAAFDRRQTILLSAEDVGLMGLKVSEYQTPKRVEYNFSGTCDRPGTMYAVFVYNNRGLHIDGRRLAVISMHE